MSSLAISLLAALFLGQAHPDHAPQPQKPPKAQECRMKCAQQQITCTTPCSTAPGASDPKNQKQTVACMNKCIQKMQPCYRECAQYEKKGQ